MLLARVAAFVVPLGFDTLAVAVALGLRGVAPLRIALIFALFEAVMPLAGLVLGRIAGERFEASAVIVGTIVLFGVGLHSLKEALENQDETRDLSFATLRSTLLAGLAISTDELAVGFPMGTSGLPIPQVIVAIALQAFVATYAGIVVGRRIGRSGSERTSRAARIVAGVAFMLLAIWLAAERFLA